MPQNPGVGLKRTLGLYRMQKTSENPVLTSLKSFIYRVFSEKGVGIPRVLYPALRGYVRLILVLYLRFLGSAKVK